MQTPPRQVAAGGKLPAQRGAAGQFYPPTVVTGVTPAMRIWQEEVFGPVMAGAGGKLRLCPCPAALSLPSPPTTLCGLKSSPLPQAPIPNPHPTPNPDLNPALNPRLNPALNPSHSRQVLDRRGGGGHRQRLPLRPGQQRVQRQPLARPQDRRAAGGGWVAGRVGFVRRGARQEGVGGGCGRVCCAACVTEHGGRSAPPGKAAPLRATRSPAKPTPAQNCKPPTVPLPPPWVLTCCRPA